VDEMRVLKGRVGGTIMQGKSCLGRGKTKSWGKGFLGHRGRKEGVGLRSASSKEKKQGVAREIAASVSEAREKTKNEDEDFHLCQKKQRSTSADWGASLDEGTEMRLRTNGGQTR